MSLCLNDVVDEQLTNSMCFFSRILCSWADFTHSGLRVEWLQAKARCDWWMEEVMLVTEEMRQNIAFCKHKYERWLSIADTKLGRQDLSLDAVEAEGRRAYALERATDKQLRSIQLAAMWRPIYKELLKTDFCRQLMVDPAFDTFDPVKTAEMESAAAEDDQVLVMALTDGLAMTTLEDEDKPRCVVFSHCVDVLN
jgi:hypothetical protein